MDTVSPDFIVSFGFSLMSYQPHCTFSVDAGSTWCLDRWLSWPKEAAETLKSAPATPALLARWQASDSGKVSDEEFYFAAKIHLGESLFEVARGLPDGGVSAPIVHADAIHVLCMVKNKKPVPFDFGAARDRVLTDFRNDAIGHLRSGDEAFLRKRANLLIADDVR